VERIGEEKASDPEVVGLFQTLESIGDSRAVNSWDPSFVTTIVGILETHPVRIWIWIRPRVLLWDCWFVVYLL